MSHIQYLYANFSPCCIFYTERPDSGSKNEWIIPTAMGWRYSTFFDRISTIASGARPARTISGRVLLQRAVGKASRHRALRLRRQPSDRDRPQRAQHQPGQRPPVGEYLPLSDRPPSVKRKPACTLRPAMRRRSASVPRPYGQSGNAVGANRAQRHAQQRAAHRNQQRLGAEPGPTGMVAIERCRRTAQYGPRIKSRTSSR